MITDTNIWHGVVEAINDPLKLGRVRVRVFGEHPIESVGNDIIGLSVEQLPWASIMLPTTSAAMNGIGDSPTGITQGSWVVGFFRDALKQEPIVMGILGGISTKPNQSFEAFQDPSHTYPLNKFIDEPDTNRLARNDFGDNPDTELTASSDYESTTDGKKSGRHHVLINKAENRTKDIPTSIGSTWSEPYQSYAAEYPYNSVYETKYTGDSEKINGHIKEYDSTPGKERIHEYHKIGTFYEIRPDGSKITKVVGEDYEIVLKDKDLFVQGNLNITVKENANIYVQGNVTQKVDGNLTSTIAGNLTSTSKNATVNSGKVKLNCDDLDVSSSGGIKLIAGGVVVIDGTLIKIG